MSMKLAHFSIFSLIASAVFFAHWILFISADFFWNIGLSMTAIILLAITLPGVFFLATAIIHTRESNFARWLYLFSSIWIGFFSFLFFSMFLTWGIFWIDTFFDRNISLGLVFSFFVIVSVLAVLYGIWNAFHPRVRQIEVRIRNLPSYWEGKKIVQLSDVHLGAVYGAQHFRRIATMANAEKPEIVVFTGDTFDGTDGWLSTFIEPILRVQAKSGVFFIIGNHETYLGVEKTLNILKETPLQVLDNAVTEVQGLKIVGLSYPERGEKKEFVKKLRELFPEYQGYPTLLLNHTPEHIKKISRMGIALQLSGHTHFGQMTPYNLITHYIHKGFDYGKFELGDYTLYTTNGIGTWGPPIRFGNTPEVVSVTVRNKPDSDLTGRREGRVTQSVRRVGRGVKRVAGEVKTIANNVHHVAHGVKQNIVETVKRSK